MIYAVLILESVGVVVRNTVFTMLLPERISFHFG